MLTDLRQNCFLTMHDSAAEDEHLRIAASICLALMTTNVIVAAMGPKVPDAVVEHLAGQSIAPIRGLKQHAEIDRSGGG